MERKIISILFSRYCIDNIKNNLLRVKNVAIADEIACAAELVMGQAKEAIPVEKASSKKPSEITP
ncbi:hypothetical protein J7K06_07625 [Candidatus Bathyarchaeota archaeon]|nr:hypothetical protein [Candidatus Bathyarchaeota archaeon]